MNCIKCENKIYCSNLCKEHFIKYFYKKFKNNLSKLKLINRSEKIKLNGKNKELVKHLLINLGQRLDIKFDKNGKEILTYSMDYKIIIQLDGLMNKMKELNPSILECFKDIEIEKFCKAKKLNYEEENYTDFQKTIKKELKKLSKRKTNLYTSSYKMLEKLYSK